MNNLTLRVISSFFLIFFFYSLFANERLIFSFSIHFLITIGLWEYLRLSNFNLYKDKLVANIGFFLTRQRLDFFDFFLIIFLNLFCFFLIHKVFILFLLFIFSLLLFLLIQKIELKKILGIFYISLSIFCLIFLNYDQNYKIFIFFIIFYTITTDVFSFFTGKLLGGPKLAPLISPGKTISGSLGGILLPTVLSLILFSKNGSSLFLIGFTSVLFSVIVQLGDLIESYFKRKCLVKESSNLIPGHGGVLDRFEVYFYWLYVFIF